MGVSRSITGNDQRGSSYDRRARREWLVSPAAPWGGDGVKVPCWECGAMVTVKTMCVDRIVPGEEGGRYVRSNIRPHCPTCSHRQGAARTWAKRQASDPYPEGHCRQCGVEFWANHYGQAHHAEDCSIGAAEAAEDW
ncbi:MAG: HNH endonuclease [Frankiaceae bacterium]|nr:HNH endonuclease [Frankiaceae bacterium]